MWLDHHCYDRLDIFLFFCFHIIRRPVLWIHGGYRLYLDGTIVCLLKIPILIILNDWCWCAWIFNWNDVRWFVLRSTPTFVLIVLTGRVVDSTPTNRVGKVLQRSAHSPWDHPMVAHLKELSTTVYSYVSSHDYFVRLSWIFRCAANRAVGFIAYQTFIGWHFWSHRIFASCRVKLDPCVATLSSILQSMTMTADINGVRIRPGITYFQRTSSQKTPKIRTSHVANQKNGVIRYAHTVPFMEPTIYW